MGGKIEIGASRGKTEKENSKNSHIGYKVC